MKAIISGKKYDTETAVPFGIALCGGKRPGEWWWSETLYRKTNGEFFLLAKQNIVRPKFANLFRKNNNGWGVAIWPLSLDKASEWAEKHLSADDYETLFGHVEE